MLMLCKSSYARLTPKVLHRRRPPHRRTRSPAGERAAVERPGRDALGQSTRPLNVQQRLDPSSHVPTRRQRGTVVKYVFFPFPVSSLIGFFFLFFSDLSDFFLFFSYLSDLGLGMGLGSRLGLGFP